MDTANSLSPRQHLQLWLPMPRCLAPWLSTEKPFFPFALTWFVHDRQAPLVLLTALAPR